MLKLSSIAMCLLSLSFHTFSQTSLWTCGDNEQGQLGNNTFSSYPNYGTSNFTAISGFSNSLAAAGGQDFSICLKNDGTVWAWGGNRYGQLGIGSFGPSPGIAVPTQMPAVSNIKSIAAGRFHTVILKNDGTVWTVGFNTLGQLGQGFFSNAAPYGTSVPAQIPGLSNIIAISSAVDHTLALKNDGTVWAWGNNYKGQLGLGTFYDSHSSPMQVPGLSNVIAIACGRDHSLALKLDGTVWAWGSNELGQLGIGTFTDPNAPPYVSGIAVPTRINAISNISSIASGGDHSLALKPDGTVWAWGSNNHGQIGNGTVTTTSPTGIPTPVQAVGIGSVVSIASKGAHSLAIKSSGTAWSWGWNYYGQLGNGQFNINSQNNSPLPAAINSLSNVFAIAAGEINSEALTGSAAYSLVVNVKLLGWAGATMPTGYLSIDGGPYIGYPLTQNSTTGSSFTIMLRRLGHDASFRIPGFLSQRVILSSSGGGYTANFYGPNGAGLIPGDLNNDNIIEDSDLLLVINNFLTTSHAGDTNGDGVVNDSDLLNVINNFFATGDL